MNDLEDEKMENEGSDYIASDEEDDDDDDSYIDDNEEDECVDWSVVFPPETFCFVNTSVGAIAKTTPTTAADFQDEIYEDSDYLHTPPESEDEEPINNYPTFKMGDGSIGVQFQLGLTFNNKKQAQEAIKEYAMETRKSLHLKKNEKEFMVVKCVVGCPFHLRISKRSGNEFWQIVSFIDDHTCHNTPRNRQAKTKYLAKKFASTLRHTPEMKVKGLRALAIEKWGVKLSHDQAYRAKLRAIEIIQGADRDQFLYLRSYEDELRETKESL
jgi:alpha-galactosidase